MSATMRELGVLLERFAKELQRSADASPAPDLGLVDPDEHGLGSQARRAARAGELVAFRVGRKFLVRRDDFVRWIERHPALERVAPEEPQNEFEKVIELAERGRRRRRRTG